MTREEEIEDFIDHKMLAGLDALTDWLALNPQATPEQASEELFQILMGKRVQ